MKKSIFTLILSLFLIFLTLDVYAQGDITVSLKLPPAGKLNFEDFWAVTLINNTKSEQSVFLVGTATEEKDGLIARGTTVPFKLKTGTTILQIKDLPKIPDIEYTARDPRYKESLRQKGEFPSGVYEVCVYVKYSRTKEDAGFDCFTHEVKEERILSLINPSDGQDIDSKTPVIFTWIYSGQARTFNYTLKITEVKKGQTPESAMESNRAFFEEKGINSTTFQYPNSAPKFEKGKSYAWMVKAGNVRSEVWSFEFNMMCKITGYKYRGNTPIPLSDWTIHIWKPGMSYYDYYAVTDANGYFCAFVPEGIYDVEEVLDPNWICTYPPGNLYTNVTAICGQNTEEPLIFRNDSIITNPCSCPCSDNTLQNGDFLTELLPWVAAYNSPQYLGTMGGSDPGFISMWSNRDKGEGISQTIDPIVAGTTYKISFCARNYNVNPDLTTDYVIMRVRLSSSPLSNPTGGTEIASAYIQGIPGTGPTPWTCYTFTWTATSVENGFTFLTVSPFNNEPDVSGNSNTVSWGQIDNICFKDTITVEEEDCCEFTDSSIVILSKVYDPNQDAVILNLQLKINPPTLIGFTAAIVNASSKIISPVTGNEETVYARFINATGQFGNFTIPSNGSIVQWYGDPFDFTNTPIQLTMKFGFGNYSLGSGPVPYSYVLKDDLKYCIRFSYTWDDCVTCDTVRCFNEVRAKTISNFEINK